MGVPRRRTPFSSAPAQCALLGVALAAATIASRSHDWNHAELIAVLLALAVGSDLLALKTKDMVISGSFLALALAMALVGPTPAAAIGVASVLFDAVRRRPAIGTLLNNVATYAAFPIVGGLLIRAAVGGTDLDLRSPGFLLLVFGVFTVTNLLNFVLIASFHTGLDGISLRHRFRTVYVPVVPSELAMGLLAVGVVFVYAHAGLAAFVLLALVLVLFQYVFRELLISQDRAEELVDRTTQLASLQVGVLAAMVQTLSLRDKMTARHSAAVARYAREMARAIGCSQAEQELVHTAGLLHDIGKFIFPDSILFAQRRLSDDDWEVVKRHPSQGARVVGTVQGYGPVAEIIVAHHERIDGRGYPHGVRGEDIPLLSRMISIADTYDVMTARDSYRAPIPPAEAVVELRRVAGAQLDSSLVEVFVEVLEQKGLAFQHGDDADFDTELALERRVLAFAPPRREEHAYKRIAQVASRR